MSTAPTVKAAILTVLGNDVDLAAVDRRWAPPTESEDYGQDPESIFFGDVEIVDDNWSQIGRADGQGRRRESYWVAITVLVAQTGDDPQAAETRAWAIWTMVRENIRTDLFAGTPAGADSELRDAGVYQFDQITARQSTGVWSPQMWAARVDGRILFLAQS